MNKTPKIGIVTVFFNSEHVIKEFLESLDKQSYKNIILYIIDNNSSDNSIEIARSMTDKLFFKTIYFEEKENWGVAKGNNIGIKAAIADNCDLILLSNNDTVLDTKTIEALLDGKSKNNASMAVPKIYFHGTNKIWAVGGYFKYINGCTPHIGAFQEDRGQYNKVKRLEYSPTCFMLIDKAVFDRIGYMDENYFVYYDDTDFIWRSTMAGSEKLVYIPESKLWHKESACTGGSMSNFTVKFTNRNVQYFVRKNYSFPRKQLTLLYIWIHTLVRKRFTLNKEQYSIAKKADKEGREMYQKYYKNTR